MREGESEATFTLHIINVTFVVVCNGYLGVLWGNDNDHRNMPYYPIS